MSTTPSVQVGFAMPSAFDVAAYILEKCGPMSHMKLQKLLYYSQAWSLVWSEAPLFDDKIEAWANGPVVRGVFAWFRTQFLVNKGGLPRRCSADNLTPEQKSNIDAVLAFYGMKDPQWLSDLTHMEEPWRNGRRGLAPTERGRNVITHADMANYYGSL
jgi:uncharacterized phage-associated protein